MRKAAHKALAAVEDDVERLRFNRCVAHLYELANALQDLANAGQDRAEPGLGRPSARPARIFVQLLAPMMPHLAEECWEALRPAGSRRRRGLARRSTARCWSRTTITLPVQVNGKKRADVTVARDADQAEVEAAVLLARGRAEGSGREAARKIIVVPQRIVNVVA